MKKIIFLGLIVFVTIGSCTQEKKSPLEGTWRCIYMRPQQLADTSFLAMIKNGQIKTFSKAYFTFVGHFEDGTGTHESYGAGTYTLNGNKYEERIIYHNVKSLIGKRYKALDEIRNDTLFHYQLNEGANEIYVRLK